MFGKNKSIYGYFLRQVLLILASLVLLLFVFLRIIYAGIEQGMFIPADGPARIMEDFRQQTDRGTLIEGLTIPDTVDYVVVDNQTQAIVRTNLLDQQVGTQLTDINKLESNALQLTEQDQTLYLKYNVKLQFANLKLRQRFPNVEYLGFVIVGVLFLLVIFSSLKRVQRLLQRENQQLIAITEQLKQEELAIQIPDKQLKEFVPVYQSLDHLSQALRASIQKSIEIQADKEEQISFLVHDLKIPLTIVKGNVELLALESDAAQSQESFHDIETAIQEMEGYIQLIIDFNLNQPGHLSGKMERVSLVSMLDVLKKSSVITSSRLDIKEDIAEEGLVAFNQRDFLRAIGNIVTNALERTPKDQSVYLTVLTEANSLNIIVEDGGAGFSQEALAAATKLFFTDNHARNQEQVHYGLGLAYAERVLTAMNGQLLIDNTEAGHGRVTVSLPLL